VPIGRHLINGILDKAKQSFVHDPSQDESEVLHSIVSAPTASTLNRGFTPPYPSTHTRILEERQSIFVTTLQVPLPTRTRIAVAPQIGCLLTPHAWHLSALTQRTDHSSVLLESE
jgi:hypothetical protein